MTKTEKINAVDLNAALDLVSLQSITLTAQKLLRPASLVDLSTWADTNRILPPDAARPGRWRTDWALPAREIYDAFTDPRVTDIVVCCCTQMLKSEFIINAILYTIEVDPCPILMLQPDVPLAREFAENRIGKAARFMPYHQPWLSPDSTRGQKATGKIQSRPFPGGHMHVRSAEERSALVSHTYKLILCDEVNKFRRDIRGDLRSRQTNFPDGKVVMVSSVGAQDECRITPEWERGDMRKWQIRCVACDQLQYPVWEQVHYKHADPTDCWYVCKHCDHALTNSEMHEANKRGGWVAEGEFNGVASFMVNAFAHPMLSLQTLVAEYIDAEGHYQRTGADARVKNFYCDRISEPYLSQAGRIAHGAIQQTCCTDYPPGNFSAPQAVEMITAAVDVQADRLEVEVRGWGFYKEKDYADTPFFRPVRYGLHYFKLEGDPNDKEVWTDLLAYYDETIFTRPDGLKFLIGAMGIDTGGHHADRVQSFVNLAKREDREIYPLKGSSIKDSPVFKFSRTNDLRKRYSGDFILVGAHQAKENHFATLKRSISGKPEKREWLFPNGGVRGYDQTYFEGLVAERVVVKLSTDGIATRKYVPVKAGARNEPLDLANYNEALLRMKSVGVLVAYAKQNAERVAKK